jgi:hypothetical protein
MPSLRRLDRLRPILDNNFSAARGNFSAPRAESVVSAVAATKI